MTRIQKIDAIPISIPLKKPVHLASEVIVQAENLFVRVTDSDGAVGWGEAASAPTMTSERLGGMVDAVAQTIAPQLLGAKVLDRDRWLQIIGAVRGHPGARTAVEVALHDLLGQRLNVSVATIASGATTSLASGKTLSLITTVSAARQFETLERCEALAVGGTTHFKVKVGQAPVEEEARFMCDLRHRIGAAAHLSADANMAWDLATADRFLTAAVPASLAYLEQPLPDGQIGGMVELAAKHSPQLCIDESLHGIGDITAHRAAGAATGVGLKLLKLGGIAVTIEAERVARSCGWQTTYASKIAETSLGAAAVLQVAGLSEDASWGVSLTHGHLTVDPVCYPFPAHVSSIDVSDAPGLGVAIDEEQLASVRLDR